MAKPNRLRDGNQNSNDSSAYIYQKPKLKEKDEIKIRTYPWTVNQQKIIDCILDKNSKIVFVSGCAGTGKSLISTYCGLYLLGVKRTLSDYLFLRSPLECSDSSAMGFIPGEINQKFQPYAQVFEDKLEELLYAETIEFLKDENRLHASPTNYLRGSTIAAKYCHVEECQSLTFGELKLILSRYGQHSKMILVGDPNFQSDLPKNKQGGFINIFNVFDNQESKDNGIYCFKLEKEDIKRSDITAYVLDKLEEVGKVISQNGLAKNGNGIH